MKLPICLLADGNINIEILISNKIFHLLIKVLW